MINTHWGGVMETNAFGTHEFMDLCELIGADAYVCGNVGSGTPQEMMEWVEYMTSDADSTHGQSPPPERPRKAVEGPLLRAWATKAGAAAATCAPSITPTSTGATPPSSRTTPATGSSDRVRRAAKDNYNWTEVLMAQAGRRMNGLSLHYYTLPTGNWRDKGSATGFGEDQWFSTLVHTLRMDELIQKHGAIMDKYDPAEARRPDRGRMGHLVRRRARHQPGFLYQQNSLRDAVVAGINLNIFNQHCDRVKMANIAQMVNVLQAMILTDKEKMILTPTYHVFEMYKVHQGATLIPVELTVPDYRLGQASVPSLHASASRDTAGRLHLSIVNLDPDRSARIAMRIVGATTKNITGRVLTAPAMNAINTFDKPEAVKPLPFNGVKIQGDQITLSLPSKSVVVLESQ